METGADFQQTRDAAADVDLASGVGSVMRLRILSRVLLPAPLRPMMPSDLALPHFKIKITQRLEFLRGRGPHAGAESFPEAPGDFQKVLAQGTIATPRELLRVRDPIGLAQMIHAEGYHTETVPTSDHIGKPALGAAEKERPADEQD